MGTRTAPAPSGGRSARGWGLGVVLFALLPSLGTLRAPWIADDAAILAGVLRAGPWADWTRSQYGLELVRFWRPVVSTSWALQAACTGIAPLPLRLFNLALHAGVAWLGFACARRLGLGARAAFLAGAWIALFPEQGGTVTWLAGRTDLLVAFFLLASLWTALGRAPWRSAPLAFLAAASKEFGFLAPLWIALFALARGDGGRLALRRAWPSAAAVCAALLWRRLALGGFGGGYPAPWSALGGGALAAGAETLRAAAFSWLLLAILAGVGFACRRAAAWPFACALAAAGLAVLPLYPLLADGFLEPQNLRLFFAAECALGLAAGLLWTRPATGGSSARLLVALLVAALLGLRLQRAWCDTHDWAQAAQEGEERVERARAALAGDAPSERPVFFADFAASAFGAYCLGIGLPDRFRAPFPVTPRPVWPWRLVFAAQRERERSPLVPARSDGSIRPLDGPDEAQPRTLAVALDGDARRASLAVDERAIQAEVDRSAHFTFAAGAPHAALEVLLFTEIGYAPAACGTLDGNGAASFSLMQLLAQPQGIAAPAQWAADVGARRAYLEFRALSPEGAVLSASRWIELTWSDDLLERSLGAAARSF